jgi:hypothetical protein
VKYGAESKGVFSRAACGPSAVKSFTHRQENVTMEEAERLIRSSNLSLPVSKAKLVAALVPRVGFSSYPWVARAMPLGASRFGGPADLPEGVEWLRVDGRPLLLMAQLNFGTLPIERRYPS